MNNLLLFFVENFLSKKNIKSLKNLITPFCFLDLQKKIENELKDNSKNFKYLITIILVIFSFNNIFAQNFVDESLAKIVGTNFISNNTSKSQPDLKLVHTETDGNNEANLYIYNINDGGFVIVSASRNVKPILAYSFENNFNDDGLGHAEYFINNFGSSKF